MQNNTTNKSQARPNRASDIVVVINRILEVQYSALTIGLFSQATSATTSGAICGIQAVIETMLCTTPVIRVEKTANGARIALFPERGVYLTVADAAAAHMEAAFRHVCATEMSKDYLAIVPEYLNLTAAVQRFVRDVLVTSPPAARESLVCVVQRLRVAHRSPKLDAIHAVVELFRVS
jgi:hypothetical protein